jgi:hypothetical protein
MIEYYVSFVTDGWFLVSLLIWGFLRFFISVFTYKKVGVNYSISSHKSITFISKKSQHSMVSPRFIPLTPYLFMCRINSKSQDSLGCCISFNMGFS